MRVKSHNGLNVDAERFFDLKHALMNGMGLHRRWIVLRTRAYREAFAEEKVAELGIETYLPRILERQRRQDQKLAVAAPLFPTYMFALVDQWRCLLSVFGVVGVIMRGSEPEFMPSREIVRLRSLQTADGLVQLPKPPPEIAPGNEVRILKGPFIDHVGLVAGMREHERVRVLLDLLGRKTDVLIASSDLAIVAA
jgi:transcriptional antiterminator RfaH